MGVDRWKDDCGFAGTTLGPFLGPALHATTVVKSDLIDLAFYSRALYIGGAGNVGVIMLSGETVTFNSVAAGTILPIRVTRVLSSPTTATGIISLD